LLEKKRFFSRGFFNNSPSTDQLIPTVVFSMREDVVENYSTIAPP